MAITTNRLIIALFDGIGSSTTPTANFTPPSGPFSLSNLRETSLSSVTRTPNSSADRQLTWDFGSNIEANVIAFPGSNATLNATYRFRAADNSGFTTNVVESSSGHLPLFNTSLGQSRTVYMPPWGRLILYIHPQSITKRFWRWHQSDTSNPDGYQEWAIARFGLGLQLTFNSWRKILISEGNESSEKLLRAHEFTFTALTRQEAYELEYLALTSLRLRRMVVVPEPLMPETWQHDAIWCRFNESQSRESVASTGHVDKRWRVTLSFIEVDH